LGNGNCGPGCSFSTSNTPISGWSATVTPSIFHGQFQPGNPSIYFNTLPDGPTVAYSDSSTLSQTVEATVLEGFVYTLMVELGQRNDAAFTASADLLINGHHITATGTAPGSGNWATFTASYVGLQADVGRPITIELLSSGSQAEFDNVRLGVSAVAIPEPAGVTLLGLGLAGLLVFARRKRAS
jgi:hypothetical protein